MAFVKQVTNKRGRWHRIPTLTVKFGQSGSTTCYVSTDIRMKHRYIQVELCEVTKRVRVRCGEEDSMAAKMSGSYGGSFAMSKSFGKKVIPKSEIKRSIPMKIEADGWWYGDYSEEVL